MSFSGQLSKQRCTGNPKFVITWSDVRVALEMEDK